MGYKYYFSTAFIHDFTIIINMGCTSSVYSKTSGTFNTILNQEQVAMINENWKLIDPHLTIVGKQIFLRIFEQKPECKSLFPFKNYWGDDLTKHPVFSAHAHRFIKVTMFNYCFCHSYVM